MTCVNELKELIDQVQLLLLEEGDKRDYIVAENYQIPVSQKRVERIPVQPLLTRMAPPQKPVLQKNVSPPVKEEPHVIAPIERKEDFTDIRSFYSNRYPHIALFNEPKLVDKKKYEEIQIGMISGSHPVINALVQALEKHFGGAELILIEEISKCPSLKLVIDHTGLSTFERTLSIKDLNALQNNPALKKELWKTIQLNMGRSS